MAFGWGYFNIQEWFFFVRDFPGGNMGFFMFMHGININNIEREDSLALYLPSLQQLTMQDYFYIYQVLIMQTSTGDKQKKNVYSAYEVQGKLYLQINDVNTYKGIVESSPYYDLKEIKQIFLEGQMQVIFKTSTKISIKFGFLKIELQSETSYELEQMKKQVQELEGKLRALQKIKGWEEDDLNSTAAFDLDCIYRISTSSGWSLTSTGVSAATVHFNYAGTNYSTQSANRKANSTGWTVTKMMKCKI